jgi:glycine/D-amino acid oxidase-like deaminating enzyme
MAPQTPLEIGDVFGQLNWIVPPTAGTGGQLNVAIVGNGYVLPSSDHWVIGSTYEQSPWEADTAAAHNITSNRAFLGTEAIRSIRYQRAARCVSSDRDPVIGKVDDGVWITTAHGSMGSSSAPFAASIIASEVLGWIAPVSSRALKSVAPERFIARQARRGIKKVGA